MKTGKWKGAAVLAALFLLVTAGVLFFLRPGGLSGTEAQAETLRFQAETEESPTETVLIYVYVTGEIRSPGVYEVPSGTRVFEVLDMAGGLLPAAALSRINQAETVYDGMHLFIPAEGAESGPYESADGKININTADRETLMKLPGIGETKAEAILAYRKKNGRFETIEDLLRVPGIGESTLNQIRDKIRS